MDHLPDGRSKALTTAFLLLLVSPTACSGAMDSQNSPPTFTENPAPRQTYRLTLRIEGAPGPLEIVSSAAQYDVVNPECLPPPKDNPGGHTSAVPTHDIPLRLQRQEGRLLALLDSGQARCELPLGISEAGLEDREVILGIRPEQISLAPAEGNGLPTLRAEVQVTEPTGPDTLVFVTLNQTKVCSRLAPEFAPQVGQSLTLQFDPARVLLFDAETGERLGRGRAPLDTVGTDNIAQFRGR